jgi:type IX secretion system PorP/SprF family membrane protein
MRRQLIWGFIFLLSTCCDVYAQQLSHYNQYILNNYIINPAVTGIENYTDIKLSARNQWIGITGAPKTIYATIHTPIGKSDDRQQPTSFDLIGRNMRGNGFIPSYNEASPHHGVGLTAMQFSTGYINRTTVYGTYAYHIGLSPTFNLSAGFGGGLSHFNIDESKILLPGQDPEGETPNIDFLYQNSTFNSFKPELNAGIWLYSENLFLGVSAQQIIPFKLKVEETALNSSSLVPHLFMTAGYKIPISFDVHFLPSIMVRYVSSLPTAYDLNLKAQFLDVFWIGGSYRNKAGFASMVGLNLARKLHISYSFDLKQGNMESMSFMNRGTHELVIGFLIGNAYKSL